MDRLNEDLEPELESADDDEFGDDYGDDEVEIPYFARATIVSGLMLAVGLMAVGLFNVVRYAMQFFGW